MKHITTDEAHRIAEAAGDSDGILAAVELLKTYPNRTPKLNAILSLACSDYDSEKALAAIYYAGKVEGIREERSRKRG